MSCKNKCCWWPHNWLCLKGLYWVFVAFFYLAIVYTVYVAYMMIASPMLTGVAFWESFLSFLVNAISIMVGFLTVAAVLKALRKIVHAVAPCCCHQEEAKEEVVVTKQDK